MRSLILVAALAWAGAASGHSAGGGEVRAVLAERPAGWDGTAVQLRHTLAPQMLLAHEGSETLEILDPSGRAFIRYTPDGVFGDFAAAAWYNSYSTARLTVPEAARDPAAPPRWRKVSEASAFGWFDPRLATAEVTVPHALQDAGKPARFGDWSIPVRIDGEPDEIHGHYRYSPRMQRRPAGRLLTVELPDTLRVALVPGPVDALLLDNRGEQPVTVLGLDDEAYLRIGPRGVEANTASRTWREWGRSAADAPPDSGSTARWTRIAGGSRYTWLEPRSRPDLEADGPQRWQVPLLVGERRLEVRGVTERR